MDPSFYIRLIRTTRARNVPIIFDASEPNLRPGLTAGPDFIKPDRDELSALMGYPIDSIETAYQVGRQILAQYKTASVITLGGDGALAVLCDRTYRIPPLKVDVVSAAGAGDAVLAGLAASIHRKQPIEDGLRLGFAAAAAVLLQPGTADCRRADIERFLPQIELIPFGEGHC
jgi:fructose-1-phosphate kinase PfkB-like protein